MSTSTIPATIPHLSILRATIEDSTQWFLTSDATLARLTLIEMGAKDIAELEPVGVIREQYGQLALLGTVG